MSTEIESLELRISSNSKRASKGIDALTESLTKLKQATTGLGLARVATDTSKIADAMSNVSKVNVKASKSFTDLYHKMSLGSIGLKQFGKAILSSIEKSAEYNEIVNLFSTSMGQYAEDAYAYAQEIEGLMGIDPADWMENQGTFMTLATGFGIAGDRAAKMSEQLTQLGYDISSFRDISVEEAMQKLQSGLAGELEPLRRIGYDLSQAKLESVAVELGIDKLVSDMTQAEKAQLRYYAIMTQVTQQQGDMAKTLKDPANQMRIFRAQVEMAARAIGNIFIPALNAILPYATAVAKVIAAVANTIASLFGYELPEVENTDKVVENTDALQENLENAQEEAKKLKSYMLGFDELNVINPNTEAEETPSDMFDFELPEYDFLKDLTESKVSTIVAEMKEWLGITGEISTWSELFDTRLGGILIAVGAIGVAFGTWKVGEGVITAVNAITTLINTIKSSAIMEWLVTFMALVKDGGFVATFAAAFPKLSAALATFAPYALPVLGIIFGLTSYIWGMVDAIKGGIDWINALAIAIGSTLAGASIGFLIGGPWGALIGAIIGTAIGLITDFAIFLWQKFDEIEEWFTGLPLIGKVAVLGLLELFLPGIGLLVTAVITLIKKWDDLKEFLSGFAAWFGENVAAPIVNFFAPIIEAIVSIGILIFTKIAEIVVGVYKAAVSIVTKVAEIFTKIVEIYVKLGEAAYTHIISPILKFIGELCGKIYAAVVEPLVIIIKNAPKFIYNRLIKPMWDKIVKFKDDVVDLFKIVGTAVVTFVSESFKVVINAVLTNIENRINTFINLLNAAISIINKIPGVSIEQVALLSIPRLAEGGFPEQGQMFIAREAGAEMVGNIGRRTAVANNDQIVAGIAGGVAEANEEQNALLREQNSLLRALLDKESGVYIDGKHVTNSVEKYQRERGRVLITGGVL